MQFGKCPGQDTRYWTHDDIFEDYCPYCGEEMEFWKTDLRVKCRNCGKKVVNQRFNLSCAAWCSFAEECLGSAADNIKPESIRKKIEDRAKDILPAPEMEELKKETEKAIDEVKTEKINMPVKIGSIYFNAIAGTKGEEEALAIVEEMLEAGELPPQIAEGIKENLKNKYEYTERS